MSQSHRRRYVALVIVGAVHILILEIFIHARGAPRESEEDTAVWSTLFLVPAAVAPQPAPTKVKPKSRSAIQATQLAPPAAETVSPITTMPSPISSAPQLAVDWMSELHSAAAAVEADQVGKGKGADASTSKPDSLWSAPLHHAGEQYTLETGELVVWVSDRCFLVSEPPVLGTPNAFAHMHLTHTQCTGNPGPRSDLFKDFPAYQKLHPAE